MKFSVIKIPEKIRNFNKAILFKKRKAAHWKTAFFYIIENLFIFSVRALEQRLEHYPNLHHGTGYHGIAS